MPIYIKTLLIPGGSPNVKKEEQKINQVLKDIQSKKATVKDVHPIASESASGYLIVYEAPEPI